MISFHSRAHRSYSRLRMALLGLPAAAGVMILSSSVFAIGVPQNLGNGLDRLVQSQVQIREAARTRAKIATYSAEDGRAYTTEESAALANLALKDSEGRLLVRVYGDGSQPIKQIRKKLKTIGSFSPTATDKNYHGIGVMNAYVSLDDVAALATSPGVRTVVLELKPRHNGSIKPAALSAQAGNPNATTGEVITQLGTYTDQGVLQHRVDQINKFYNPAATLDYEGATMQIACISNSFAANTANPASLDVTNNDLPGNASNTINPTPVFVLQDDLSSATSDDEGRGMCQIVYKMAPKAKVGFATANGGEVGFANNIRGLAGLAGFTVAGQSFAADVICDDVGYLDEPFYEDGIIGAGVDDVNAAGVSYFSSAANDIGVNGYESVIRIVPNGTGLTAAAGNTALAGTNINLANVPTNLYAGGFHNFNPNGLDIAQTVNVASNNSVPTILQWNDPYDQGAGFQSLGAQIYAASGASTSATTPTTTTFNGTSTPPLPVFTAGQGYQVQERATSGTFDAIVTIVNPDGTTLISQDTGADETVTFVAPVSGQYQIRVTPFGTTTQGVTTYTTGTYTLNVFNANITPYVMSDWNLLAFNATTGAYIPASSLVTNNIASNQPIEFGYVNRTGALQTTVQYVLARANTPVGRAADRIRYLLPGNGLPGYGPAEYFTYNTVTTSGHATARGCNGTAAYPFYRPNIPESFTSPGPATIYFDKNSNLLPTPEVRLQPRVAAMDGGNISANEGLAGLGSDSTQDYDAAANFFGTSAAAPHAAACALLVLEAHGGRRSLAPAQVTSLLQTTAFAHDLDPNFSSGTARTGTKKVSLTISSDQSSNGGTGSNDANSFAASYTGPAGTYLTSLVFNPQATDATAGNTTGGNNGLDLTNTYFSNVIPGVVFPAAVTSFAVGNGSIGLTTADVTAATSNLATLPSTTQNYTLTLTFPTTNFTSGKLLHFKINRSVHSSAVVPVGTSTAQYSADIFGGSVLLPDGTGTGTGMSFRATTNDGTVLNGTINNRIGAGYSVLDGYGFINVQAAATALTP